MTTPRPRAALLAAAFAFAASSLAAADAVIMPDGYVIRGEYVKEKEVVFDLAKPVVMNKVNGFDAVADGPKNVVFSTHVSKGGKIEKDLPKPDFVVYKTKLPDKGTKVFPPEGLAPPAKLPDFNANWWRKIVFRGGGGFENVEQKITSLDPYTTVIASPTHSVRQFYHTAEYAPAVVRTLLSTHPDLKDPQGKVDPVRRLSIATTLKDVGTTDPDGAFLWFAAAREELERLKKDAPAPWDKEPTERFDKLKEEIDAAESRQFLDELEAAVGAGRYEFAARFLAAFALKGNDPKEITRFSTLKGHVEKARSQYELTARLLRDLLEREGGLPSGLPAAAVAGAVALKDSPRPKQKPELVTLAEAGAAVLAELHPDTAGRLELFRSIAEQADRRRKAGEPVAETPEELLALAVTGWLKGKNGAETNVKSALRCWAARQLVLGYLREETANSRTALLQSFTPGGQPADRGDIDLIAQVVTMIPPPFPEDPANPGGTRVPKTLGIDGIVKRNTGPLPGVPGGRDYFLRLPSEYHHGRAYPVLIALTTPGMPAEEMLALLAGHCDRHGYILIAPEWTSRFGATQAYDFTGKDHPWVTASLRDLLRHFQVDPDRVFLFGFGEGANFAVDVGMARPDLFAGVGGFNPNTPPNLFIEYWRNAQKLPAFFVLGDLSGALPHVRKLYEKWMQNGFPALLTIYRGRGAEWFRMEVPRLFDWMGRKARVRGTGSLRLDQKKVEPWQVLRETDNRFYWVGVGDGGLTKPNLMEGVKPGGQVIPAKFRADLLAGNKVELTEVIGVKKLVIWLERDMIDWSKEVHITRGGGVPLRGFKPRIMKPDLRLMLEELYKTGDRKMLFFGKLEIDV